MNFSTQLRIFACFLIISFSFPAFAAEDELKDYSSGLEKIKKFGLPDTSQAIYVDIPNLHQFKEGMLPWDYTTRGKGWLLKEIKDDQGRVTKGIFVVNGCRIIEVLNPKYSSKKETHANYKYLENPIISSWKKVNLDGEIKNVLRFLKIMEKEEHPDIYKDDRVSGRIFLFAMHLFQQGKKEEANQILNKLFSMEKNNRHLLIKALNLMAFSQYLELYVQFLKKRDWNIYHQDLQKLIKKYGRSYKSISKLEEVSQNIQARLQKKTFTPEGIKTLSPADQALFAKLKDIRKIRDTERYSGSAEIWMLPETWQDKHPVTKNDIDLQIRAKGLKAIPLLIQAAKDDQTLTDLDYYSINQNSFYLSYILGKGRSFVFRPATRGEVAKQILTEILPRDFEDKVRYKDDLTIEDLAADFYKKYKNKPNISLALYFYKKGYAKDTATEFLLNKAKNQSIPELEKTLTGANLKPKPPNESFTISVSEKAYLPNFSRLYEINNKTYELGFDLAEYIAVRGDSAGPLAGQLADRLDSWLDKYDKKNKGKKSKEDESFGEDEQKTRQNIEEFSSALRALPTEKTTKELLQNIVPRNPKNFLQLHFLMARLKYIEPEKAIKLILDEAVASDSAEKQAAFSGILRTLSPHFANKISPANNVAQWQKLINSNKKLTSGKTIAELFLVTNEVLFSPFDRIKGEYPSQTITARELLEKFPKKGMQLLKQRVTKRLAGIKENDLPPYPEENKFPAQKKDNLKNKLSAIDDWKKLVDWVTSLSINELNALPTILEKAPRLNAKLLAMTKDILLVDADIKEPEWKQRFLSWKNKAPDKKLVMDMQKFIQLKTKANQAYQCLLKRNGLFGYSLLIEPLLDEKPSPGKATKIIGYTGQVFFSNGYKIATWPTAPMPKEPEWRTLMTSSAMDVEELWETIDKLFTKNSDASGLGAIRFFTNQ